MIFQYKELSQTQTIQVSELRFCIENIIKIIIIHTKIRFNSDIPLNNLEFILLFILRQEILRESHRLKRNRISWSVLQNSRDMNFEDISILFEKSWTACCKNCWCFFEYRMSLFNGWCFQNQLAVKCIAWHWQMKERNNKKLKIRHSSK